MSDEVEITGGVPVESNGDDDGRNYDMKNWKPENPHNATPLMREHLSAVRSPEWEPDKFPDMDAMKYSITIDKAFVDPKELYKRPGRIIPVYGTDTLIRKRSIWRNRSGCLWFNFKRQYFIFNEGGRGVTLTIAPTWCPFRLYIAGKTLMYHRKGGWTFRSRA